MQIVRFGNDNLLTDWSKLSAEYGSEVHWKYPKRMDGWRSLLWHVSHNRWIDIDSTVMGNAQAVMLYFHGTQSRDQNNRILVWSCMWVQLVFVLFHSYSNSAEPVVTGVRTSPVKFAACYASCLSQISGLRALSYTVLSELDSHTSRVHFLKIGTLRFSCCLFTVEGLGAFLCCGSSELQDLLLCGSKMLQWLQGTSEDCSCAHWRIKQSPALPRYICRLLYFFTTGQCFSDWRAYINTG